VLIVKTYGCCTAVSLHDHGWRSREHGVVSPAIMRGRGSWGGEHGEGCGVGAAVLYQRDQVATGAEDGNRSIDRDPRERYAVRKAARRLRVDVMLRERCGGRLRQRDDGEVGGERFQGHRARQVVRSDPGTSQRGEMPADTKGGAQVTGEGADVRTG
jgi:hypothetical protein